MSVYKSAQDIRVSARTSVIWPKNLRPERHALPRGAPAPANRRARSGWARSRIGLEPPPRGHGLDDALSDGLRLRDGIVKPAENFSELCRSESRIGHNKAE
jgi:hypothetical protein